MPLWIAVLAVAGLVVLTVIVGWALRRRENRPRNAGVADLEWLAADERGERATLVQFSTEVCTRCPQVRRMLREIVDGSDGVAVAEVDLTHRAELAARLHILQTPTVFVLDATGAVRSRFAGAPRRDAVAAELDRVIGDPAHV
ncbi:thioredoxin [Microbacterium protaetiae]|uniref:Thioredoxin n=1 Tax=Microbacterium protaetiae TaxID=2509458 RepID=A0A4P6ES60_9MICO|nr:thioredoxin family protein [Microbacterium protaetiae]QAY60788.1 thioredoxin [Microbacterium protaetiae]